MEFESNLLLIQGSTRDNTEVVIAEQAVENYNFSDDETFNVDWD